MTTDGGKTWTKTLYIDNQHGVADFGGPTTIDRFINAALLTAAPMGPWLRSKLHIPAYRYVGW